jgi:hypothetical protein
MNSKFWTLFGMIAGLLLVALVTRNADAAWMTLPFLAYLAVGILRSPTKEAIRLKVTRSVEPVLSPGGRAAGRGYAQGKQPGARYQPALPGG